MKLSVVVRISVDLARDDDAEPLERQELTDILLEELGSAVDSIDFESYTVESSNVEQVKTALRNQR